jgi:hypothetical protein
VDDSILPLCFLERSFGGFETGWVFNIEALEGFVDLAK